ncbi:MAG: transaldolase family protein [Elusimicrobiota bacterium]
MPKQVPQSAVEKLANLNKEQEIWFDSSPLILDKWIDSVVEKAPEDKRETLRAQLGRFYVKSKPEDSVLVGITTNPPLSLDVIKQLLPEWEKEAKEIAEKHRNLSDKELFWRLYQRIVLRGAKMFEPIFKHTHYKRGYLSGQVDPRILADTAEMLRQGISFNQQMRNVMIKMPGTKQGIYGIMLLTALGIPTNATLTFTLSQLIAVAEAVKQGLALARANGVDLSQWKSVVTHMLGRYEDNPEFDIQAKAVGVEISETDRRWAGLAIFKKAYKIYKERHYESKLLAASMRIGPVINGKKRVWHVEKIAGGDIVLTIFPNIFEAWLENYEGEDIKSYIDEPVPQDVVNKLLKVPYFREAYEEGAQKPEDFINHPAVIATGSAFAKTADDLEDFIVKKKK